eukprot:scaffold3867_cov254-Pinguiococcus_pyrenoidosus.AAC.4
MSRQIKGRFRATSPGCCRCNSSFKVALALNDSERRMAFIGAFLLRSRMLELDASRVEAEATVGRNRTIQRVAHDRVACMGAMHSNLVRPAGLRPEPQPKCLIPSLHDFVPRDRALPILGHDLPRLPRIPVRQEAITSPSRKAQTQKKDEGDTLTSPKPSRGRMLCRNSPASGRASASSAAACTSAS